MGRRESRAQVLREAWIGDAVLTLYVRLKILREDGSTDGAKAARMTSNEFLAGFGEPSEVEAEIGRVFLSGGLDSAFQLMEERLVPVFDKRESKRQKSAQATVKRPGPVL